MNLKECDISDLKDAQSASNRAKSKQCKQEISELACLSKQKIQSKPIVLKSFCSNSIRKDLVIIWYD